MGTRLGLRATGWLMVKDPEYEPGWVFKGFGGAGR